MPEATVSGLDVAAFTVPLEEPEADGTLTWDATTVVVVHASAAGVVGMGFTYGTAACATVVRELLRDVVVGRDALNVPAAWKAMARAIRNQGRPGIASMAIAAVDTALWDLHARLLDRPLHVLLDARCDAVAVYGSGGFTSLTDGALCDQLAGWVHDAGIPRVKMKIGSAWGTEEDRDLERAGLVRDAIGPDAALFVDANGLLRRVRAVRVAAGLERLGVTWFEEPVSSDDLDGLRRVRDATAIDVAAGEYVYDLPAVERLTGVVDVLQLDVSRCAGITEWMRAAARAGVAGLEVSGHCAQSLHVAPACATPNLRHLEYFADHARADRLLFDGVLDPVGGVLRPDTGRPGNGLTLKQADAERFGA